MPGLKKKPTMGDLKVSMEADSRSFARSYSLSDTGSFSQDSFTVGPNGITQSPLSQGEISSLRLDQLTGWTGIGRGNSSRVYRAVHTPTGKALAVKVLQADLEGSRESRHMLLNEIKIVFNASSNHLGERADAHPPHERLLPSACALLTRARVPSPTPRRAAVSFYDAFIHDGSIYLALEYMDCGSLEGLLQAASQTPTRLVPEEINASILFQILQGLIYLHRERHSVRQCCSAARPRVD